MWRAGESSVSFKTSVLGRRRGENPKVLKQRAGRAECSLLAQESYFISFKLDQIYRRLKKVRLMGVHLSVGSLPKGMGSRHGELLRAIWLLPGWITAAWRGLEVATRADKQLLLALSMSQEMPEGLPGLLLLPNFFCPCPGARHSEASGLQRWAAQPVGELGSSPNYLSLTPCFLILASCSLGSLDT